MTLQEIKNLANKLMDKHGLIKQGWTFEFDGAKRRYGLCSYRKRKISMSKHLSPLRERKEVENTILHEIAHAIVGGSHGHNHVWRSKAMEIGCNGERCGNDVKIQGKYKAVCKNGHTHYKHRKPKRKSSCGLCSSSFNPEFILNFNQ